MNELRRKVLALLGSDIGREVLVDVLIDVIARGLGRLGGRPRNGAPSDTATDESGSLTHVESDVSKPVTKRQIRPISLPDSESGSALSLIPDLSKQSGSGEGELDGPEPAGFLEFWGLYPKKVGKTDARRLWKRKRPPITKVRIALEWQRRSLQWQQGYVPNPSTYINQGRWDDEPPQDLKSAGYSDREIASANGIGKALEEWGK